MRVLYACSTLQHVHAFKYSVARSMDLSVFYGF